ncbi:TIGR04282 family arsenosugar biosynthesis glycosyltransferase [Fibrella sp. HMF5335]|uniref:TIGR04282 family arsenosugar biosynthesis glycosyltransferase n=1 Tax=Fibrella rubiginis TaxID=2817060 RepID=A0A939GG95_9BACT|nr:TIGR04282 family arsenosugar biosynthesis glycosyltransferase [Fibrella rubiginis]MBO0937786.1 TIGR04282 family arsenosugar biosynthesis glycosyltransferase [Fibrella rubiginis]
MPSHRLVIFVKNPIPGTVKTRIAKTVGVEKATQVYRHLVQYTQQITRYSPWEKVVYYADFVNPNDGWSGYRKVQQTGNDLGQRMQQAFQDQFATNAERVVLIGSDCLALTQTHLTQAFAALDTADVVIGPATDGGYYLLGMKQLHTDLFANMPWSQPNLLAETELALQRNQLTYSRLETLTDIDEWSDYVGATGQWI